MKLKGTFDAGKLGAPVVGMFLFGLVWETFTTFHMFFMVGGAWMLAKLAAPFMLLFYIPFHAIGLGLMAYPVYKYIGKWKVPEVELTVAGDRVVLGQELEVRLRFTPRVRLELNKVTLKLEGKETAKERVGTNTRTYNDIVHEETVTLSEGVIAAPRREQSHKACFKIPESAMCSFETKNNRFTWTLSLRLDIAHGIDFADDYVLKVLPELGEEAR